MAARRELRADIGLSARMFFTMFLLAALYLGFALVLLRAGVGATSMMVIVAIMLGVQYFFSDRLVLWSMGARVVSESEAPDLHAMVGRLAQLADLPKPKIAIVNTHIPNAFATGRNPNNAVVAFTTGIINRLDRSELEGVAAHELAHIKHRDMTVITLASFFATVASFILQQAMWWGFPMGRERDREGRNSVVLVYLASLVVWIVSFFLIRALSRYREYAADRGAALLTGAPSRLASALIKISNSMTRIPEQDLRQAEGFNAFFIIPAVSGESFLELLSTHPSLEKRLAYLQRLAEEMERR